MENKTKCVLMSLEFTIDNGSFITTQRSGCFSCCSFRQDINQDRACILCYYKSVATNRLTIHWPQVGNSTIFKK